MNLYIPLNYSLGLAPGYGSEFRTEWIFCESQGVLGIHQPWMFSSQQLLAKSTIFVLFLIELSLNFHFSVKLCLENVLIRVNPFDDALQSEFTRTLQH